MLTFEQGQARINACPLKKLSESIKLARENMGNQENVIVKEVAYDPIGTNHEPSAA
jgi:hypothetical protein